MHLKKEISGNERGSLLLVEGYLNDKKKIRYVKEGGNLQPTKSQLSPIDVVTRIRLLLYEVFLPRGYPESVSKDYTWYQIWDTLQACCSTFSGMLAVQAVLMGVGVGKENATPLAAALAWFTKDGVGMISGIGFTWLKGTSLDSECKKWRFFADIVNDVAFCLELSVSAFQDYAVSLLCLSSALKAVVGVAGGATRAALTHHQACRGNTADVAAKDSSQETLVNLISMAVGIWMINTSFVQSNVWPIMCLLVTLHLFCNYRAVKALRLRKFNEERYLLTVWEYLLSGRVQSVEKVNLAESVVLGCGARAEQFLRLHISTGESLEGRLPAADLFEKIFELFAFEQYLIIPELSNNRINIALKSGATDSDVLKAYFHCVLLALLNIENPILKDCPLNRTLRRCQIKIGHLLFIPTEDLQQIYGEFAEACVSQGWNLKEHVLKVNQWRIQRPDSIMKKQN